MIVQRIEGATRNLGKSQGYIVITIIAVGPEFVRRML